MFQHLSQLQNLPVHQVLNHLLNHLLSRLVLLVDSPLQCRPGFHQSSRHQFHLVAPVALHPTSQLNLQQMLRHLNQAAHPVVPLQSDHRASRHRSQVVSQVWSHQLAPLVNLLDSLVVYHHGNQAVNLLRNQVVNLLDTQVVYLQANRQVSRVINHQTSQPASQMANRRYNHQVNLLVTRLLNLLVNQHVFLLVSQVGNLLWSPQVSQRVDLRVNQQVLPQLCLRLIQVTNQHVFPVANRRYHHLVYQHTCQLLGRVINLLTDPVWNRLVTLPEFRVDNHLSNLRHCLLLVHQWNHLLLQPQIHHPYQVVRQVVGQLLFQLGYLL